MDPDLRKESYYSVISPSSKSGVIMSCSPCLASGDGMNILDKLQTEQSNGEHPLD
jgi:hypothetical protein